MLVSVLEGDRGRSLCQDTDMLFRSQACHLETVIFIVVYLYIYVSMLLHDIFAAKLRNYYTEVSPDSLCYDY
jgi:hypothetical protein